MKRIFAILLTLMLCVCLTVRVNAAGAPRLMDGADLLSNAQEAELLSRLDEVSEALQVDVVIITLESTGGYTADQVIEAFYDQYGYGYGGNRDGVMLLVAMAERDYRILSNGFAADAITTGEIYNMGDTVASYLSEGDYVGAFDRFIDRCVYEIEGERNGFPFNFGLSLGVSLVIGFAAAFIATGIMRAKLKSVRSQTGAQEYTKPGSMKLTRSSDLFLYRTVDRRRKPQNTSSGSRGGGGGGRNIGGGKF